MPGAVLQAVLSDARTKVLQSPQVRTVDNVKAQLSIGDRVPTATGSFQPGIYCTCGAQSKNTTGFIEAAATASLTPDSR